MSSLSDQVSARKRKLADLKTRYIKDDPGTSLTNKKTKIELVNRNFKSGRKIPADYKGSTVEDLSHEIEHDALRDFKQTADKIISAFATKEDHKYQKSKAETNENETIRNMKRSLKGKLEKLDRATDEEIKRIVRKNFIKDAVMNS